MAAEVNSAISPIVEWYRGAGSIRSIKRGLDNRSFIVDLSGRKEMRILAVIYDPSTDEDIQEFVESLTDSYRRARIGFDRLDLWVPSPFYRRAQALMEEAGRGWVSKVILRPLKAPVDTEGEGAEDMRGAIRSKDEGPFVTRVPEPGKRVSEEMNLLIREVGREIGEGVARSLQDSLKSILSSIDIRRSDPELIVKIYELEKRVELLESFIRLLGNYGVGSIPQVHREVPPVPQVHREVPPVQERPQEIAKDHQRVERVAMDVVRSEEIGESNLSADDILAEILNNPWVSILRRKGGEVEGEGS